MRQRFSLLPQFATHAVFLLVVSLFVLEWKIRAFSQHGMDGYDGALKLIPWAYISSGFVPYKDFGIIYPPGMFLLSHIIPFVSLEQRNLIMYGLFFIVVICGVGLMNRLRSTYMRLACAASGFMLLSIPLLDHEYMADPLLGLLLITVVFCVRFQAGRLELALLFLFPFLIVLWRWDRIGIFLLLETLCFVFFAPKAIVRVILVQWAGAGAGSIFLAMYFFFRGGLYNGLDFLYGVPFSAAMPYRDLPVPHLFSYPGILFLVTWLSLAFFFLYAIRAFFSRRLGENASHRVIMAILASAPFCALPYALGRSDGAHIHPMLFLTGLSISIAVLVQKEKKSLLLAPLLMSLIGSALWFLPPFSYDPKPVFSMTRLVNEQLLDCRKKIQTERYRSLFVGRTVYEHYFANNLALYFLNPSVPPATRYFSEDPGVQNSCLYGERIAGELNRSPKPMLAFITDQPMDRYEENKTREMKSCGKIERYLAEHSYRIIGSCSSYGIPYEIRVYGE